ncbi:MAG: hypothetical protein JSS04_17460 [Proteobacteria bacterium]|nr:hypothetical protein [Pseudomonadota bacterium]
MSGDEICQGQSAMEPVSACRPGAPEAPEQGAYSVNHIMAMGFRVSRVLPRPANDD